MAYGEWLVTVDQGNSSAKAVLWEGRRVVRSVRVFDNDVEKLLPLFSEGEPEGCIYCGVGHSDAKFLETLRCFSGGSFMVLTPSTPLPIGIEYSTRSSLGSDRVAAAVGANMLFPGEGVLVVDTGTAVTLDVVSGRGVFFGGNISPGIQLRFESLHRATSRLPLVSADGDLPEFGHDTASAIRTGVVRGVLAEIEYAFRVASSLHGAVRVVIAGSDAPIMEPLLKEKGIDAVCEPFLVGLGLTGIFRYNGDLSRQPEQ